MALAHYAAQSIHEVPAREREREVNKTHVKTSAQLEEEISSKVHVKYVDVYVHQ